MGKKLTSAEFIERAKKVHGDKYDYSKVNYVNNSTNVILTCAKHGEFQQLPSNHLSGKGCIKCGVKTRAKKKTKTTEQFIKESEQIHGDRYDYSQVKYTGKEKEVKIICSEHGEFNQKANIHLMGSGCPKCGLLAISKKKRLSQNDFVKRSAKVHNDKYDYSLVDYQRIDKKIKIICPEHGVFEQIAADHLHNGAGCPACVGLERYDTNEFIRRANEVHGNKYDYSKVEYISAKRKVLIICPEHGEFTQVPQHHIKGIGCPGCKADILSELHIKTTEDFISDAQMVHGDKYDYSQVKYVNGNTDIRIICPEHGPFTQLPRTHLQNSGCPYCADSGINLLESGILYYLRVETRNQLFWKIGVTNNTVGKRFKGDMNKITVIKTWAYKEMTYGFKREQEVLRQHTKYRYRGGDKPLKRGGNTELFIRDVLGLDAESE